MISTATNQGRANGTIIGGSLKHERLIECLQALARDSERPRKKVCLTPGNRGMNHRQTVRAWLAEHRRDNDVFFLPSYSPQLNPNERLSADLKLVIGTKVPACTKGRASSSRR